MKFESILLPGIDDKRPLVIAGPCSAETEDQVMATARELARNGIKIFRAGVWKPRTKPGGFEGVGSPALKWLKKVKEETGMYVATEVATEKHVYEALKYGVDMMWLGARTVANPFAVQEIADTLRGVDIPVLIKNPVNPDLELWIGAIERLYNVGICRLGVIHRGFSTSDKTIYRNLPQWHIPIELKRRYPDLPVFCDPSHIGGKRQLIQTLSQQAMDLKYSGLIIESHCSPDEAWSDKDQQVTPASLKEILSSLVIRDRTQTTEDLSVLRDQIDQLDNELLQLLCKRMRVAREIGHYKLEHDMPILQTQRYDEILTDRAEQGEKMDMNGEFIKQVLEAIHAESVRQQMVVMERKKD
ncbi:MAG TPA: 3-deoxy-7-phosphoheptulonate synthase [Porphyromonadaceae bacterium]|jgi:chorismate mutase|uniref:chorismate mutase n=1 Tax=Limibacterium fermenti TaxID=3229863 RepID=UPI000E9E5237|nr:3-deoxy-7-phosphoheptulonate synthase [Porphyromonadaceae bacterium]HBK32291.1 3-deoxy-7-phosphoheptulonate synthase [Porphyromonadaceae bacterium]HBL34219.1 3-deoxy-7-phosphoheptulonate synthase [Porphyromonadaceae bacterium]HBX19036.1 3-deoxy-7-phosphoheptulonate synthase [Porphyromonadaceae bacterium]HBX45853.1 3-deoxy-7-phosphoheptulonate synthase [Porphyromonadaceae bacterium]